MPLLNKLHHPVSFNHVMNVSNVIMSAQNNKIRKDEIFALMAFMGAIYANQSINRRGFAKIT